MVPPVEKPATRPEWKPKRVGKLLMHRLWDALDNVKAVPETIFKPNRPQADANEPIPVIDLTDQDC